MLSFGLGRLKEARTDTNTLMLGVTHRLAYNVASELGAHQLYQRSTAIDWRSLTSSSASSSHLVGILLLTLALIFLCIVHFSLWELLICGPPLHARSTSFGHHVIANAVKVQ